MDEKKKKDAYYFSHDCNAHADQKVIILIHKMGLEGYGIYWILLELLRSESSFKLELNKDYLEACAARFNTTYEKIYSVINDYKLFIIDDNYFFANRLLESMGTYNKLKTKLSEAGRKGGLSQAQARLKPSLSDPQALKERKLKEKKEKEKEKEGDFPLGKFKPREPLRDANGEIKLDHNGNPEYSLEGMVW
jgi:hypothetical protein